MKYDNGPLTINNRGSIGGITFSRSAQGNYARIKGYGIDKKSPGQMSQRALTSYLARLWRSASIPEQLSWNHLASLYPRTDKLGNIYYLSGYGIYMAVNRNFQAIYEPTTITCPPLSSIGFIPFVTCSFDVITTPGSEDIVWNFTDPIIATEKVIIQSSGVISNGIGSNFKWKKIGAFDSGFSTGDSILQAFLDVFGSMPETGDLVMFRIWRVKTTMGFASTKTIYKSIGYV